MTSDSNNNLPTDLPRADKKPKSMSTLALYAGGGVGLVVLGSLLGIGVIHVGPKAIPPAPGKRGILGHDSPVEIAGGSIHVCHRDSMIPVSNTGKDWLITSDADLTLITTESVSNFTDLLTNSYTQDWVIHIADAVGNDAVKLTHKQGTKTIFVQTRDTNSSLSTEHHAVILPPDDGVCSTAGSCAVLQQVAIESNGSTTTGNCNSGSSVGKCGVYIGMVEPKPSGSYTCEMTRK